MAAPRFTGRAKRAALRASKSFGDDRPLRLGFLDREAAVRRAQGAAAQVSAIIGAPIYFDIGENESSGS